MTGKLLLITTLKFFPATLFLAVGFLLNPFYKSLPERIILWLAAALVGWLCVVGAVRLEQDTTFQASRDTAPSESFIERVKRLYWQRPRVISEMPDMFSPEGTAVFRYLTKEVENRAIVGKKLLMDYKYQENRNRLTLYFQTMEDSNFLVLDIYTQDGIHYVERININDWKNNRAYSMAVTWSNTKHEFQLFIDASLKALIKTSGEIFSKTGITAKLY